ncbi:MAG: hypothetical protein KW788_01160 [Candidatus Doudnabacteria bacterium]|nr:hypothetical protein [Candidatus Doudnabacteria bacterium]
MNKNGFGIIGFIITLAIIAVIVYGAFYVGRDGNKQNQIEQGQDQIQAAKDAAEQQNEYNATLQGEANLDSGTGVNYRSAQTKAQQLQK